MSKARMAYFESEDVLHVALSDQAEAASVEICPNVTAELNEQGELIGIETLNASAFIRDFVLDSVQGKVLKLLKTESA